MNQPEDTTPGFSLANFNALFEASFGLEHDEIKEIFPLAPKDQPLPDTVDTILDLVNDETNNFRPTAAWYTEMSWATCPLAVYLGSFPDCIPEVLLEVQTYGARLTLSRVSVPPASRDFLNEDGPWVVLTIDVGRGAPLSYLV